MRQTFTVLMSMAASAVAVAAPFSTNEIDRINDAASVLREIHSGPDKDIPQELWDKAQCVIVVPSLKKAAFIIGGEFGKGLMSCRRHSGWSAPAFMEIGKGSWGLQIGAQSIDLVLLVMNERGMERLLQDKVVLGMDASVAAGPVGRDARAATDAQLNTDVVSYSRTQGLFAGINLSGGIIRPDVDDNHDLYGRDRSVRDVLSTDTIKPPAVTQTFMSALQRKRSQ
jgi:lipid-binding SYLF domain-containing protein